MEDTRIVAIKFGTALMIFIVYVHDKVLFPSLFCFEGLLTHPSASATFFSLVMMTMQSGGGHGGFGVGDGEEGAVLKASL